MPVTQDPVKEAPARSRRTQGERRAEAERRVLDAAARLVADGGSSMATLAEVGRAAGYSRGIVTHHFGAREALLGALAREAQERIVPPGDDEPGLERLIGVVKSYIDHVQSGDPYARAFLVLWGESVSASSELRAMFAERNRVFSAAIADNLEAGQAAGTVRCDIDRQATAAGIIGQLRGVALDMIVGEAPVDPASLCDAIVVGLRRSLRQDRAPSAVPGRRSS